MNDHLKNENESLKKTNIETTKKVEQLEEINESIKNKNKSLEIDLSTFEKKNIALEKNTHMLKLNNESNKNLIIKILTSKVKMMNSEIEKLKSYLKNELILIKKEI